MSDANETSDIATELVRHARDAAYVAVGLGVLGLQRAQAIRHELTHAERPDEEAARLRTGIATGTRQFGEWVEGTLSFVTAQLAPLGAQLPEPARGLADKARCGLEAVGAQLRQFTTPGT
jgi:hypothetical protein